MASIPSLYSPSLFPQRVLFFGLVGVFQRSQLLNLPASRHERGSRRPLWYDPTIVFLPLLLTLVEVLGVEKGSTKIEIKKAYHKVRFTVSDIT